MVLATGLLVKGNLPPRVREVAILRVAWRTGSAYEWGQHVRIGLDSGLDEAEIASLATEAGSETEAAALKAMQREIDTLKARNQQLDAESESLRASLKAYEAARSADADGSESKVALKSRIGALEQSVQSQSVTVQSLRAELAAANERLARQASYFRDELKRLGTGTQPASVEPRQRSATSSPPVEVQRRQTLAERIGAPRPVAASPSPAPAAAEDRARLNSYLKALGGDAAASVATDVPNANKEGSEPRRRSSLLDRITSAGKTQGS